MRAALRLAVGAAPVVAVRARVPADAEPREVGELGRDELVAAALAVRVLDAQHEAPAGARAPAGS